MEIIGDKINTLSIIILVGSLAVNMFNVGDQSQKLMLLMTQTMQLILFTATFQINLPANLISFMAIYVPTVSFDILEQVIDWSK